MSQAYILILTQVGKAQDVAREVSRIRGVATAQDVTGPYDVVVRAEGSSLDEISRSVLARILGVAGITRTLTCPIASS